MASGRPKSLPGGKTFTATVADIGLSHKQVHEARQIRNAEAVSPGIVRRTLDEQLARGNWLPETVTRAPAEHPFSRSGNNIAEIKVGATLRIREIPMPNIENYDHNFDDLVKAIGRIASMYSDIEFKINEIIWMVMNVERSIGACLTAQMIGPGPRFRALLSILALREAPAPILKSTKEMRDRITSIANKRNRIVHDPWLRDADGSFQRVHVTADNKLDFNFKAETIADLDIVYDSMVKVRFDLDDLRDAIAKFIPSPLRSQFDSSPGIKSYMSYR